MIAARTLRRALVVGTAKMFPAVEIELGGVRQPFPCEPNNPGRNTSSRIRGWQLTDYGRAGVFVSDA
jgi:hypothetical protein